MIVHDETDIAKTAMSYLLHNRENAAERLVELDEQISSWNHRVEESNQRYRAGPSYEVDRLSHQREKALTTLSVWAYLVDQQKRRLQTLAAFAEYDDTKECYHGL